MGSSLCTWATRQSGEMGSSLCTWATRQSGEIHDAQYTEMTEIIELPSSLICKYCQCVLETEEVSDLVLNLMCLDQTDMAKKQGSMSVITLVGENATILIST